LALTVVYQAREEGLPVCGIRSEGVDLTCSVKLGIDQRLCKLAWS